MCEPAQWAGIVHKIGLDMCYWLVPITDVPIANTMVQHVTTEEMHNPDLHECIDKFNAWLKQRPDHTNFVIESNINYDYPLHIQDTCQVVDNRNETNEALHGADDIGSYNNLIRATFLLDP